MKKEKNIKKIYTGLTREQYDAGVKRFLRRVEKDKKETERLKGKHKNKPEIKLKPSPSINI